jgi:hypothetical protein
MSFLSPAELRKYDWRPEVFIKKLKEKTHFEIAGNKKVVLIEPSDAERILRTGTSKQLSDIRFSSEDGSIYKLSDFVKTSEFGGKGEGGGTIKEDRALSSLLTQIKEEKVNISSATIPIKIGNKVYDVYDVISTPGTPKSDFHFIDVEGKEIVWISHKDGSTAKHFQQWGGMSAQKEAQINRHKESQAFVNDLKKIYPNGLPNATTIIRKIKDNKLKMMSVYGNEYGSQFSRQNVTVCIQGDIKLRKEGSHYKLTASHVHENGDNLTGDYEPVFMAIYKGDRNDFGVKGTRIVIAPKNCRKTNGEI